MLNFIKKLITYKCKINLKEGSEMKKHIIGLIVVIALLSQLSFAEEGMWPMSEIHKLNLSEKGFEISAADIYNPDGLSLVNGICKINGCTGSFVSENGLILTNHHCAYRAVQSVSTKENDYIKNGFLATNTSEEIIAKNYTVRIIDSYKNVSEEVEIFEI